MYAKLKQKTSRGISNYPSRATAKWHFNQGEGGTHIEK